MRKVVSLFLVLVMLCCLAPGAFAISDEAQAAADALHDLGLFQGKGTNADGTPIYDLDAAPTRNEAITMLVRLLGKEAEAKEGAWDIPFTDVADWAKPYVGYAYANGLTKGTGDTTFGGDTLISASQYLTFVLRALGYDSNTDFQWDKAWELSDKIGMTNGEYNESSLFLRANVAQISFSALSTELKGNEKTLADQLIEDRVFFEEEYAGVMGLPIEPFTLTSFGDKYFHDFLMSLNPDENQLELGPTRSGDYYGKDHYLFPNQFLDEIIFSEIDRYFKCTYSEDEADSKWDFVGTRVITEGSDGDGFISIATFDQSHKCHIRWYTIYGLLRKGESNSLPSFGNPDINEALLSLNPDQSIEAGNNDGTLWHMYWHNKDATTELNAVMDSFSNYFSSVENRTVTADEKYLFEGTRVEIANQPQYQYLSYSVEYFHDGIADITSYVLARE